ncbi:EscI/YscI/HrpB family type III secretion system inner rod protein [Pseudomonas sp. MUP55]|uniref:EscI/YscI/HrpB family type III secretion system inner rod protein n=1 Tax=Pseudomonas sp. MUP55 TaxID=3087234 RepID=UPI002A5A5B01|nr:MULTISPECIES: EscI/YscI/HrpB family type III secretion system inner rod protein [unclassified Pseudomonas]WPN93500.1 type III secretion apparatus protein RspB [Pseudomonas sp. MUP56]WPN99026.1 type III secretion apparatus protein RspB [Pseudomonas sp. MUP55]
MIIKEVVESNRRDFNSNEHATAPAASSADVDFFKAALTQQTWPSTASSQRSNILTIASSELAHTTDQLKKTLKAISKNGNDELLGKFPNQLSNALFQSQILVKSLGKATQCIDKISNLQ